MKKRLRRYALHVGRATLHISRWTLYISAAALVLLTIVFIVARFTLPMIEERKSDLEQYLGLRSGHPIRIESLHAYWDGLHPGAQAKGLQVYASDGVRPAIRLSEVRISLALLPLLWGELEINSLLVVNPSLALERLTDGRFRISGFNPLQTEQPTDDEKFVGWLFRQNRLEIENGELQWFDHREAGASLRLARVNLTLRNRGDRHQLGFSAVFPPDMCRNCSLILDINGNPFTSSAWDGDIYLRTEEVNIKALPLIAREKLPETFRGKFNAQIWSEWEQGRPVSIKGNARVVDLRLPVPGWTTPLGIHVAGGDLSWQAKRTGWRLDVANPVIGLTGPEWAAEHLRIVFQPEESQIQVKHLDLEDITGFVTRLKNELSESGITESEKLSMWLDYWIAAKPEGTMNDFNLRLIGNAGSPEDFSLETDVRAVAALAYQKYPGVQGLSGHLSLARHAGQFQLDAGDITVTLPRVFRAPLVAQRLSGDLSWEKSTEHWLIEGSNLRLVSEDGRGTGTLSVNVPLDTSISPYVKLRVDFSNGNGAHAARYYPAYHLPAATLAWMERSFTGGNITQGYLVYDGPTRHFPFRDNTGKFELRGHVRHGIYQYLPGWEPIRQAEVDVAINGPEVLITGQGKIAGLNTDQVVVESRESSAGQHVVHVSGKVSGPLNETLTVLREIKSESDTTHWLAPVLSGMRGSGDGILSLNLSIPLHQAHSVGIDGEYRFLKSTLLFSVPGVAAEAIDGSVRFTETGIREGSLHLQFLGGSTVLAAGREQDQLLIHGQGTITAPGLAPLVGPLIAPRIAGSINWNGMWRWSKGVGDLRAEADIGSLKVLLPPPLDRPDGLADEKLVVRTESSTASEIILDLSVGNRMSGKLDIGRNASGWHLAKGRIGFGEARTTLPEANGLHVSARMDSLDINQWWPWLGGGSAAVPEVLTRVSAEIRSLNMFDRNFGGLNFDFYRSREVWSGTVNGAKLAGNLKFSGKGPAARF
ncbi:MAG: DUF3971 domain-containing protein, partial [Sulfuricaulis sp.]|nr:DUF3971 domain-containing protein [Sulfuricaulis sp.]